MAKKDAAAYAENKRFADIKALIAEKRGRNTAFTMRRMMMDKWLSAGCYFIVHYNFITFLLKNSLDP
jgi:hypothetical protein